MESVEDFKQYLAYIFTIIVLPILRYLRRAFRKMIGKLASVITNMERLVELGEQINKKLDKLDNCHGPSIKKTDDD